MTDTKKPADKSEAKNITTEITFSIGVPGIIEFEISRTYEWRQPKKPKPSNS